MEILTIGGRNAYDTLFEVEPDGVGGGVFHMSLDTFPYLRTDLDKKEIESVRDYLTEILNADWSL